MEHRNAELRQVTGFGVPSDDAARFLSELRQLRDGAGLGQAELAARAHFPYDAIRAAEAGPALPDLPVLCAYVRGCGGISEEWEERWRSLTRTPSLPVAAARHGGRSDAATAGARISSAARGADAPDPSVIIAALNRVAEEMASPGSGDLPPAETAISPTTGTPDAGIQHPGGTAHGLATPAGPHLDQASSDKNAGWDPIRVSTAWPVLNDTPRSPLGAPGTPLPPRAAARPWGAGAATPTAAPAGQPTAAPWGHAPWATTPPNPVSPPMTAGPVSTGPASTGPASTGRSGAQSGAMLVVIAAVVLCVLAVLLAVFA
jgi:DNA-binding XRE family transcriptional regulator